MRIIHQISILILVSFITNGQKFERIQGLDALKFTIIAENDTIEFIKSDSRLDTLKPVIVFFQGSQPKPLIMIDDDGKKYYVNFNFNQRKVFKDFHLVCIAMPKTPVEFNTSLLTNDFTYVQNLSDKNSYFPNYLEQNYAENYIQRANIVIDFISKQKWAKKGIIVVEHSQGAKVALQVAYQNKNVSKVGFLSGNPLGRFDQLIREQRKQALKGKISREDAQLQIDTLYMEWKKFYENPKSTSTDFGDPVRTWTSFSKPLLETFLSINIPIFVGYGTDDIVAEFCDLLPLYFIRNGKTNLTLKPYVGLEHNFAEVDDNGKPNFDKMHWNEVMEDFIKWTKR